MGNTAWSKDLSNYTSGKVMAVISPIIALACSIAFILVFMIAVEPLSGLFWLFTQLTTWAIIIVFAVYLIYKRKIFNILIFVGVGLICSLIVGLIESGLFTALWGSGLLFFKDVGDGGANIMEYFRYMVIGRFFDGAARNHSPPVLGNHIYFTLFKAAITAIVENGIKFGAFAILLKLVLSSALGLSFISLFSAGFTWMLSTLWVLLHEILDVQLVAGSISGYPKYIDDSSQAGTLWHINIGAITNRSVFYPLYSLFLSVAIYYMYESFRKTRQWWEIVLVFAYPITAQFLLDGLSFGFFQTFTYDSANAPVGLLVAIIVEIIGVVATGLVAGLYIFRYQKLL